MSVFHKLTDVQQQTVFWKTRFLCHFGCIRRIRGWVPGGLILCAGVVLEAHLLGNFVPGSTWAPAESQGPLGHPGSKASYLIYIYIYTVYHITPHHITWHHITSHHTTPHHTTLHHITSHHIASHHCTAHHITSHHIVHCIRTPLCIKVKPFLWTRNN